MKRTLKFNRNFSETVVKALSLKIVRRPSIKSTLYAAIFILAITIPCHSQTPTPDQMQVISLFKQAEEYNNQNNFPAAINLYQQAIDLAEHAYGLQNPNYISLITNLGTVYKNAGMFDKAEEVYKQALSSWEKSKGADDLDVAYTLNMLSILYYSKNNFKEALSGLLKVLALRKKFLGLSHLDVANTMHNLAAVYSAIGDYKTAEDYSLNSLSIYEKVHGENDPQIINSLVSVADIYLSLSKLKEGITVSNRALALQEKHFGPNHPGIARILDTLGHLYYDLRDYEQTEIQCVRSLKIRETALYSNHPEIATSLNNLSALYVSLNKYFEAEVLMKQALKIYEVNYGNQHTSYASCLHNLGSLYSKMGEHVAAENVLLQTIRIRKTIYGAESDKIADTLNNLAGVYADTSEYGKAMANYEEALKIRTKVFGNEHPLVAGSMNNIAGVYLAIGDFKKALNLYENALTIRQKTLGNHHLDVAEAYNNLAAINKSLGKYDKSLEYYKKSLLIVENSVGKDSLQAAKLFCNIGEVNISLGRAEAALPFYEAGLTSAERILGKKDLDLATFYNNIAGCHLSLKNFEIANLYYNKALLIRVERLPPVHPALSTNYFNIGAMYAAMEKNDEALLFMKKGIDIDRALINQTMAFSSDRQKQLFLLEKQWHLHGLFTLASKNFSDNSSIVSYLYDTWAQRKGIILESQKSFNSALLYSENSEALKVFLELSEARTKLSQLTFAGSGKQNNEFIKYKIEELQKKKENLEIKLSDISKKYSKDQRISIANSKTIIEALPIGKILVDFAKITPINLKAQKDEKKWLEERYFAFIINPQSDNKVEILDLGESAPIDNDITEFKKNIAHEDANKQHLIMQLSQKIYALIFKPIENIIGPVRDILISPDGNLNLIPFEVLQKLDGKYLIEDYTFNYIAAGRDVIRFEDKKSAYSKVVLFGDPDFDMVIENEQQKTNSTNIKKTVAGASTLKVRSTDMRGMKFSRLPYTKVEVQEIQRMIGVDACTIYTGKDALEKRLEQTESPSILHLATHGFFLDSLDLGFMDSLDPNPNHHNSSSQASNAIDVRLDNPLLRSGIVLAGANNAIQDSDLEKSDGIITAEKILNLRLRGTELVALSACKTGLGDVQKGEGVYGLRRAFLHAGAKSIVMSMWSVPDQETKEQMVAFYHNIIVEKMDRCRALRQAALKQMEIVKRRYGNTNPIYWGAFVFLGEP